MRLFGSERIARLMDRMGAQEGEVLTHPLITRSIEQAQKRVELQNFQSRKRLLEYDDVMNQQREVIYSLRAFALEGGEELKGEALKMVEKALGRRVETVLAEYETVEEWDFDLLRQELLIHYMIQLGVRWRTRTCVRRICSRRRRRRSTPATHGVRRQARVARHGARRAGRLRRPAAPLRHAQRARREVEGSPLRSRPAAQRDPLSVVGPEGSAHRVQAGGLHDVRRSDERHRGDVHGAVPQGAARRRAGTAATTERAGIRDLPPEPADRRRRSATTRSACSRTSCRRSPAATGDGGRSARRRSGRDAGAGAERRPRSAIR